MIFAEIVSSTGRRLHIGCVMAAGPDWIEVSVPIRLKLEDNLGVCFGDVPNSVEIAKAGVAG